MAWCIKDWAEHFENSESRKVKELRWVPFPNKHDGKSYRRIAARHDGPEIFCAWALMVELASKMPTRGVLADKDGPLTAEDMSDKTGFPKRIFENALNYLSSNKIGWIFNDCPGNFPASPETSVDAGAEWNGREWNGMEGKGTESFAADAATNQPKQKPMKASPKSRQSEPSKPSEPTEHPDSPSGTSGEPKPLKPSKPRKVEPSGSKHAAFIETFSDRWKAKYGCEYVFENGKDAKHVQWFLEQLEENHDRWKRIVESFLSNPDKFFVQHRHSLGILRSQFRRFTVPEPPEMKASDHFRTPFTAEELYAMSGETESTNGEPTP